MATHSSVLAWRIPETAEPGGLQSVGLLRVGHDWATSLSLPISKKGRQPSEEVVSRRRWLKIQTVVCSWTNRCRAWGADIGMKHWNLTPGGNSEGFTVVKHPPANAGDPCSFPGLGRSPGEGNGNPLQYYCLGESPGQRSLVGYSPWTGKQLGMTERPILYVLLIIPCLPRLRDW